MECQSGNHQRGGFTLHRSNVCPIILIIAASAESPAIVLGLKISNYFLQHFPIYFTFEENEIFRFRVLVHRAAIVNFVLADQFSEQTFSRDVQRQREE